MTAENTWVTVGKLCYFGKLGTRHYLTLPCWQSGLSLAETSSSAGWGSQRALRGSWRESDGGGITRPCKRLRGRPLKEGACASGEARAAPVPGFPAAGAPQTLRNVFVFFPVCLSSAFQALFLSLHNYF